MKVYVCNYCGSPRVQREAWVDVNDGDNVSFLDSTICDDCGSDSNNGITKVEVDDDFDMLVDFYKEKKK